MSDTDATRTANSSGPREGASSAAGDASQAILYATDLARLYRRVREDEARLGLLEARLGDLARVSLDLVEASSAEAAAGKLALELSGALSSDRVAIFVARSGKHRLIANHGEAPARSAFLRDEVEAHAAGAAARAWPELGMGERVLVLPFKGRGGQVVGFAAARAPEQAEDAKRALELLARFAGVLLESHLVDEARARSARTETAASKVETVALASLRGESDAIRRVRDLVKRIAGASAPVLVLGETGTGKELVARAIHDASPRRKGPFIALNCGALPENLVESEIFGHEAGAFTGATKRHRGKVELAHGGTLFLDELGEMPRAVQVKLLRFLQDSRFVPLGAESERTADVRIIAATNKNVALAQAQGELREDLVYRLNVFTVELPPLRERAGDAVLLARSFARDFAARAGLPAPEITLAAEAALACYPWPGNVRELSNVIERSVLLSNGRPIDADAVPRSHAAVAPSAPVVAPPAASAPPLPAGSDAISIVSLAGDALKPYAEAKAELLARFEVFYCNAALARSGGNIAKAARIAKLDKKNLHHKLREHGIDARSFKG